MRVYVATPVNARKEPTLKEKRAGAKRRADMLRCWFCDEHPDAEVVTPFDAVPLSEEIEEPQAIGRCIALLLTCDTILLDRGWTGSKGCALEYHAAKLYNLRVIDGNGQF